MEDPRHRVLVSGRPLDLSGHVGAGVALVPAAPGGLAAALADGPWDGVVVHAQDAEAVLAAADVVRRRPPEGFLLLVGAVPLEAFPDSAVLPYEMWTERTPSSAGIVLTRALEALREREALAAVRANRTLYIELSAALRHGRPLAEAIEDSMGILARALDCAAASFWQPSAAGDEMRRVACTGPLRTLDQVASGDDRAPVCGNDRLLELPIDTPVGQVLEAGVARYPDGADGALLLPATSGGRTIGVIVLVGALEVRRRPTTFELATAAAAQLASHVLLHEAEDRLHAVTSSSSDAIVLADGTGIITAFNVGAERMFGHPARQMVGRPLTVLMPEGFRQAHAAALDRVSAGGAPRLLGQVLELTGVRASGEAFPIELSLSMWDAGRERRYAGIIRDVTARHHAAARIEELAYVDQVTGLGNEPSLRVRLAALEGVRVGLLALDLGRFGTFVEALGAAGGDEVLRAVAERLRGALPPGASAHRRYGDEFLVLLEGTDVPSVMATAEAVIGTLRRPLSIGDRAEVVVQAHIGATSTRVTDPDGVMDQALRALGVARQAGAWAVRRYEQVEGRVRDELRLEGELRRGIGAGELVLHHQPIVDLPRGRVRGVESLVRWQHPQRGLLPPGAFIDLAERSGLIDELGRWVIDDACRQAAAWDAEGLGLTVGFNVSPRQLLTNGVVDHLRAALARTGADPRRMTVELTESSALTDLDSSRAILDELRALGVRLALDDFGVGESSLGRLADLPVDILKLDRSLVVGLPDGRTAQALTRAALQLAHGLGLRSVAEGVEEPEQLRWLHDHGCRDVQGFFLGRPVPAAELPLALDRIAELLDATLDARGRPALHTG